MLCRFRNVLVYVDWNISCELTFTLTFHMYYVDRTEHPWGKCRSKSKVQELCVLIIYYECLILHLVCMETNH